MSSELFAAYVAACVVLLFIPGPTLLLVISYALTHGRRSAFHTIAGVLAGDAVAMALSLLGLGALLATSATLFAAMKLLGATYLVYLGVQMWRAKGSMEPTDTPPVSQTGWAMARDAFTVTVLNPKSGMFFVAFLPQFMNPAAPLGPQVMLLGGTFLLLAFVSVTAYALLASELRRFVSSPRGSRAVHRLGGAALVGAGLLTFALKRAS